MSKTLQALDEAGARLVGKFDSRKFIVFAGAFAVSLIAGLAGVIDGTTTIQAVLVSALGYGISEAVPDLGGAIANKSVITRNISASSVDRAIVADAISPTVAKEDPQ